MKREAATTLSMAAAALGAALLMQPAAATAQSQPMQPQPMQGSSSSNSMAMVSARVAVTAGVDADKAKPGDQIRTRLANKVVLKDGKELPVGTTIVGVVAMDDMQMNGASKLALNFNKAELKDGSVVPLKATMVGIFPAESQDIDGRPTAPGDEMRHTWVDHPDAIDEIGAMPGIDLHSKITSQNSGVLVSSSKHDVKLKYGTEIALAVAPEQGM